MYYHCAPVIDHKHCVKVIANMFQAFSTYTGYQMLVALTTGKQNCCVYFYRICMNGFCTVSDPSGTKHYLSLARVSGWTRHEEQDALVH